MIFNSYDEDDILNQPIIEEVEREIIKVRPTKEFKELWDDITNALENLKNIKEE